MQLIVFIFLCFVWGTTWIAIKISLEGLPPLLGACLRFMIASFLLFLYAKIKRIPIRINRQDFILILISSLLMYTFDYGLIYWGEQYLSAGITAIFFASFPIFTGLWAIFLFRNEKFGKNKFLGLILSFIGIIFVFYDQLSLTNFNRMVILASVGIIFGAAAGAMSVVIVKKYLTKVEPIALALNQMIYGVLSLFMLSIFFENFNYVQLNVRVLIAVGYLGLFGSAIAFALYYWLLQALSAVTLSLIIYITPMVALYVDYLVFDEIIQARAIIGTVIIFSGIALTQLQINKQKDI